MAAHSSAQQHDRAKVTIDCTLDERAYIKMLAARSHMTLSEFILSYLRKDFPQDEPNKDTMQAIKDTKEGRTTRSKSLNDFWAKMGVKPSAHR